ncbi:hypothetical protein NQ315_009930 [Exocentrus adspersus]|uniref:CHK kinase-like domain-containing protein n=1 Tax=Exocentrus adspersus TaxID=1586481 RepID=A0AAV8WHV8_9CUCU|nr:hypothetical protein NQ315_009930 [Exocentrus adspersus]
MTCELLQFLKNALGIHSADNFRMVVHTPNKKGDGFLGDILFVTLEDSHLAYHLVVKQAFTDASVREMHPIRNVFLNEIHFYTNIWPRLDQFQARVPERYRFQNLPRCFGASAEERSERIVLENLKRQGFQVHDKKQPLDGEQYEMIMKVYGRFHALSFAYKALHPEEYAGLQLGLRNAFWDLLQRDFFKRGNVETHRICLQGLSGVDDAVTEKYSRYPERCNDLLRESLDCRTEYTVILHGDCWSNNVMFKYEESGALADLRLLDFQMSKEGSPCCDLSYTIYSGASKPILQNLDSYLHVYHDSLSSTLKAFGCDSDRIYPFHQLKKDWKRYCKLGFSMALMIWRMKLTEEGQVKDLQDMTKQSEEELRASAYDETEYRRITRDLVLHMFENDFL